MIFMNFSERVHESPVQKYEYRLVAQCYYLKLHKRYHRNEITEPSGRRTPFLVRTTTAFNTSPFLLYHVELLLLR